MNERDQSLYARDGRQEEVKGREEADEVALNDLGRDVEIPNINKLCLSRFHNKL